MGGWAEVFKFLAGEDIDGNKMNLRMTVLSRLGCAHLDDLAGASLDDYESVFAERRALLRVCG